MFTYINFLRLSELGQQVGIRMLDLLVVREKGGKREIKLLQILIFIKSTVWKVTQISYLLPSTFCSVTFFLIGSIWSRG